MSGFRRSGASALVVVTLAALAPAHLPAQQSTARERLDQAAKLIANQGAREALKQLQPLVDETGAPADAALAPEIFFQLGAAYFQLNDYPKAMDWYTRARDAGRNAGDRLTEARSVFSIAQTHKNRGEYSIALSMSEDARRMYERLNDSQGMARSWQLLGSIQDLTGRHREALASYERARQSYGSVKTQAVFRLLNEIGITHKNLGNYQEAVSLYQQGLEGLTEIGDRYGQAMLLANLASVHALLGQPELAIAGYQQSLAIARAINERRGESMLLGDLGSMMLARGDLQRASEYLEQQLQLTRSLGNRNEEANALGGLGELHAARGDVSQARQYFERSAVIQREIGAQARLGSTLIALADLAAKAGNWADAGQQADEALQIAHKTDTPELEWKARLAIGRSRAAQGYLEPAVDELRASAAIINNLRANVGSDAAKIGFVDERQEVFATLAATLVTAGRVEDALEAAEAGRARAFADLLEQRQVRVKAEGQPALSAVRVAIADEREGRAEPGRASPGDWRTRSGGVLDASLSKLRSEDRELASLVTAESPTPVEIGELARRLDATFVEYLVTENQLLIWVVTPGRGIQATVTGDTRARIEALTSEVRKAFDAPPGASDSRVAASPALRELHRLLISPVGRWLPSSPDRIVVIVPHGPLALLPFAALENEPGQPLIERHTLAFAPSIGVYRYTADKRSDGRSPSSALIVADPLPPPASAMPALPGAREEGRQIVNRLGSTATSLMTGAQASEVMVKRDAHRYRLLHFATHGLVSAAYPLASSLLLSEGGGEDGFLRVDEIFSLSLTADLVVLSGCSTGLGKLSGDGVIGLSRAFIYAGTPAVVVSQWDVSDRSTAYLMNEFYAQLRQRRGIAAALRHAQLETRKRFADPALWAAFLIVGEPG
jgi:CHAT domain-containing protein/tetratricopeptide (TPR) repeat protein